MDQEQFLLNDKKRTIRLNPLRISLYMQSEIIEAVSENKELFYLFFYRNNFLTAVKAKRLRLNSFIEHAFKKGMVFEAPHPFIHVFHSPNQSFHALGLNPLLKKLEKQYTPQEKAYILTFFESFFPKRQLFDEIKSIFFEYRRNGQLFLGYQIIHILMDFAPNQSMVKSLGHKVAFKKYADLYHKKSKELFAKDSIYAEKVLYQDKANEQSFNHLVTYFEKDQRWLDLIALYIDKLAVSPCDEVYHSFQKLLEQHFSENDTTIILENLSSKMPFFLPLQNNLFNKCIKARHAEEAFQMLSNYKFELSKPQVQIMAEMVDNLNIEGYSEKPEKLCRLMKIVIPLFPEKAEALLSKSVIMLLKTYDITYVDEWLSPFKADTYKIVEKVQLVKRLSQDLEQLQTLGTLYYEMEQLDKAIECFSWEMELKPDDPKPLQWLSKIYKHMGMKPEADAYLNLCINMQK